MWYLISLTIILYFFNKFIYDIDYSWNSTDEQDTEGEIMRMREEIKALQQGIVKMESTICLL